MVDIDSLNQNEFLGHWLRTLSNNIRDARLKEGMSISELAMSAGLSTDSIISIERGTTTGLQIGTILYTCWALGLKPAEAFGYVNTRPRVSTDEFNLILAHRKIFGGQG